MAAGKSETFDGRRLDGRHHGPPFSDGDFFKWFEAVAQLYASTGDPRLDELMDRIIPIVAQAQRAGRLPIHGGDHRARARAGRPNASSPIPGISRRTTWAT